MAETFQIVSPEDAIAAFVSPRLIRPRTRPLVVGLCGAQGSGKSTIAESLVRRFANAATLSLDDLYHTRATREAMARDIHPLFETRGVPGTHDVALGHAVFAALDHGGPVPLPRFDKARDDRAPRSSWMAAPAPCDLLIFEGWCVGATAQDASALRAPVNALELNEDKDGVWRAAVNTVLATTYQSLFARIDVLILLKAPDIATIVGWRQEQERSLRAKAGAGAAGSGVMSDPAIVRFVAHYERLTRHILAEMPARADLVIPLAADRTMQGTTIAIASAALLAVTGDA